jgi:hypothetical protein
MAAIGEVPERVHSLFNNEKSIPKNGQLMLKFWAYGAPQMVTIDDQLPYANARARSPMYTKMSNAGAWWGPFAEKASAKFYGNYDVMSGGWTEAGMTILTGMPSKKYYHRSETE